MSVPIEWLPRLELRNTGNNLERYIELVQQCRLMIELLFPAGLQNHPIVHAAADAQMQQPGQVSYQWQVAQQALGVRA